MLHDLIIYHVQYTKIAQKKQLLRDFEIVIALSMYEPDGNIVFPYFMHLATHMTDQTCILEGGLNEEEA